MSDIRSELSAAVEDADADASRAVAHADAMRVLAGIAWTTETAIPSVDLDDVARRLTGADRVRWRAALNVAARTHPDTTD